MSTLVLSHHDPYESQHSPVDPVSSELLRQLSGTPKLPPPLSLPNVFQRREVPVMNEQASPPGQPGFPPPLSLPTFNQQKRPAKVVTNTAKTTPDVPANAPPPLSLPKVMRR